MDGNLGKEQRREGRHPADPVRLCPPVPHRSWHRFRRLVLYLAAGIVRDGEAGRPKLRLRGLGHDRVPGEGVRPADCDRTLLHAAQEEVEGESAQIDIIRTEGGVLCRDP